MNLSKELKKKRDAEARLNKQSPTPTFSSDGTTETYIDISGLATKSELTAGLADKSDTDHTHEITELTDVSITYSTNAGKFLKVNSTEDGIDLGEASGGGASDFLDLTDTPSAYTGEGGKIVAVKSTADGLEFVSAPPATNGIPTGGTENQLLAKDAGGDFDVKWMDAPASVNGLPSGGTAGQMLSKIDGTDYNAEWVDVPTDAECILTKPVNIADFTGKDGYILAYDETAGEFYLKLDSGGGGGNSGFGEWGFYTIDITISTMGIA